MKKRVALLLALALAFPLTSCSYGNGQSPSTATATATVTPGDQDNSSTADSSGHITAITLGDRICVSGEGAIVEGSKVSITSSGTYYISGRLKDGQVRVYTEDSGTVRLVLNGVHITCTTSAPIYVINAKKTVITLADGTANYVTDGTSYSIEDLASGEPDAVIFSNDDLTVNGNGSLTVNANYKDGIKSDDDLKITDGDVVINAVNDGIKGRDSITVKGGNITVNAGSDGMQANNDEDVAEGYIAIEAGTINITAGMDGIQAETSVTISGGEIMISSGGGSANRSIPNIRSFTGGGKGIKAGADVTIEGGTINIDSFDDSINSNGSFTINGSDILLASGDDGIHADSTAVINGGNTTITRCYEGIESAVVIINNGDVHIISHDDGINCIKSVNGVSRNIESRYAGDEYLSINGGYIVIDANGDGLDTNGPSDMTGGVVIINGPEKVDRVIDRISIFKITGGFFVAVDGGNHSTSTPSITSTQYSIGMTYLSPQSAGTMAHIETEDGKEILTFVPTKEYQSLVLCSPELETGVTYIVYSGGSSTGMVSDGLYSGGIYTGGAQVVSFTIWYINTHVKFS